ncbi:DUF3306 domain-containing protein [Marinobacter sediminum]|uniref:DUF3306 domain-containing protein n=1 Tax=Marinobacter sediminum TaxID=256323 RepID=UPI0020304945|nr:DUF3306 domain-containing protein [Marinobacter sediminum]MCM0614221.1 DUF3306 domain-containing protein [Marinobacter sediminum]
MTESRLQRWARKKAETSQDAQPTPQAPAQPVETAPEASATEQELAVNQNLPEQEILAKYNLPDPDTLEQGTDITGFLRKEIPEFLRRKALRSLWRSNPIFGVLDGLNEYDEDFSKVTTPIGGVKTAYKVGKGGFLDPEKRARERREQELEAESTDDTVRLSQPKQPEAPDQSVETEEDAEAESKEVAEDVSKPETHTQPKVAQAEAEPPAPRFRPRMQFEG